MGSTDRVWGGGKVPHPLSDQIGPSFDSLPLVSLWRQLFLSAIGTNPGNSMENMEICDYEIGLSIALSVYTALEPARTHAQHSGRIRGEFFGESDPEKARFYYTKRSHLKPESRLMRLTLDAVKKN